MGQSDRQIPVDERCSVCDGVGWTWWAGGSEPQQEGKWVVCRECIGTGRGDHKGRKRAKPDGPPTA